MDDRKQPDRTENGAGFQEIYQYEEPGGDQTRIRQDYRVRERTMKIRTQLIAGIVIFALLLAIISGFVIATNQQVEHIIDEEELANKIALEIGELGYLSNDYILYREPQQAERWNTKFASISEDIASLSPGQPEQQVIADQPRLEPQEQ